MQSINLGNFITNEVCNLAFAPASPRRDKVIKLRFMTKGQREKPGLCFSETLDTPYFTQDIKHLKHTLLILTNLVLI